MPAFRVYGGDIGEISLWIEENIDKYEIYMDTEVFYFSYFYVLLVFIPDLNDAMKFVLYDPPGCVRL